MEEKNIFINNDNISITPQNKTGEIYMKFDDEEPIKITDLYNYVDFDIKFTHKPLALKDSLMQQPKNITFTSKEGKTFSLILNQI